MGFSFSGTASLSKASDSGASWNLPLGFPTGDYDKAFDSGAVDIAALTAKTFWDFAEASANAPVFEWGVILNLGTTDLQIGIFVDLGGVDQLCYGFILPAPADVNNPTFHIVRSPNYNAAFAGETGAIAYQAAPNAEITKIQVYNRAGVGAAQVILFAEPA